MFEMTKKILLSDSRVPEWAQWIITEREKQNLSRDDLAIKAGVSRVTLYGYELGKRKKPDVEYLMKISTALGYAPETLPRIAKILPGVDEHDELVEQAKELFRQIQTEEGKQSAIAMLRGLAGMKKKKNSRGAEVSKSSV